MVLTDPIVHNPTPPTRPSGLAVFRLLSGLNCEGEAAEFAEFAFDLGGEILEGGAGFAERRTFGRAMGLHECGVGVGRAHGMDDESLASAECDDGRALDA